VFKAKFKPSWAGRLRPSRRTPRATPTSARSSPTSRSKKVQGLYVPGYYQDVGVIAEQARELGLKVVMMGGDGWDSAKLFELGGTAVEGSYCVEPLFGRRPEPAGAGIHQEVPGEVWRVPDSLAALGYDSARVVLDALKRSNGTGPSLRDAIAQTKDFPGVAGTITLDANRNPVKPAVVLKVEGGKFKYVTTIAP
jgi:branched-chain amino acid transport system substrate-binding protein